MKYKVGDRVKIRENFLGHINAMCAVALLPNRIATIKKVHNYYYEMGEIGWGWGDCHLENCLEEQREKIKPKPILTRWEILDI